MAQLLKISTLSLHKSFDRHLHDDTLASFVDSESSNIDSMLVLDRLNQGSLTNNLDELLASITVLVDLTDIARGHGLVERDVESEVDTAEPRGTAYCQS